MIDTIKIVSMINFNTYNKIRNQSIVKTSYHSATGEIFYTIINDSLEGSYSSSLSIRVGNGAKYKFINMYYIEIEGSYHKLIRGYNSHNGFYNAISISIELINMVEQAYKIKLPTIEHWFLQRIDIAICFNIETQENVKTYINNLNSCSYPRRKLKHYEEESLYLTGSTTTLKIYNKMKEFKKHDLTKFKNTNFDIKNYFDEIKGFVRFECEIKKRKLKSIFSKDYIRISNINYEMLRKIWYEEFSKLFKLLENDLQIVQERGLVQKRLNSIYKARRAKNLYNFYLLILVQGLQTIKGNTNKSTFYQNIGDLKRAGVDFSQKINIDTSDCIVNFNPFEYPEVL